MLPGLLFLIVNYSHNTRETLILAIALIS